HGGAPVRVLSTMGTWSTHIVLPWPAACSGTGGAFMARPPGRGGVGGWGEFGEHPVPVRIVGVGRRDGAGGVEQRAMRGRQRPARGAEVLFQRASKAWSWSRSM